MLRFLQTSRLKRLSFPLLIAFGLFSTLMWGLGGLTQSVDASTSFFNRSFFEGQREEAASACTIGVSNVLTYTTLQQAVDDVPENGTVTVAGVCENAAAMAQITKSLTLLGDGNGATLDAKQAGRVLYITGDADVTVQNLDLRGGEVVGNGGGIYVMGAEVTLNNTTVENNQATSGGGVYLENSTALFKGGSNIAQNEATSSGGGIFAYHSMVTVTNSSVMTNTAQQNGGGLYADNDNTSTITLLGGTEVVANEATLGTGGGVHATQGMITLDGIIVSNHVITDHGAALYLDVIEATLKDNVFLENRSREGSGAALYLLAEKAEFSGNLINNNQAESDGGGFWVEVGEITLDNNTFLTNKSVEGRGGALHLQVTGSPQANISGNIINQNEAKSDGGGFSLRNIDHDDGVLLSNNEFNENKTLTGNGGALYLYNTNARLNNNNIADNEAHNNGGGLYAHSNSDVTLENDNEVLNNTAVTGSGGGLYLNSGAAIINDNRIRGNSAHIHGGGYFANNENNTLDGNSFSENEAQTGHGGGLYINGDAATLTENRIEQNESLAGRGGGMYIVEVAARISDSHIIGNQAVFGGGLFLSLDTSVVSNNMITDNTGSRGGGFFLSNSSAKLIDNEIMTNTASDGGGLFLSESNNAEIKENLIAHNVGNSAGGGLYLELSNAKIEHNQITTNTAIVEEGQARGIAPTGIGQARGIAPTGIGQARGIAPTAQDGGTGGAFFLTESNPTLKRNTIRANKADNGGALYFDESQPTVINNIIADNQAIIRASALYNVASSPFFKHNTIANNTGGQNGYALFVTHKDSLQSTLRMTNTILSEHNIALYVEQNNSAILKGSLWYNNQHNWNGTGTIDTIQNISGNPHFITTEAGNYRLAPNSAAIDEGLNTSINEDIDLDPRPTYQDKYDIGADEYYTPSISLDYQATPNPVMAGENLTYTIEVRNTGNVVQKANITVTLSNDVTPTIIITDTTWTRVITPGEPWRQEIPVTVHEGVETLNSMAEVTTNLGNSASKTVTSQVIAPDAALAASFEAITDTILAGEVLTYNIRVTNTGNVHLEPTIMVTFSVTSYPEPLTWTKTLMIQPNSGYLFEQQVPVTMTFDFDLPNTMTLTSTLEVMAEGVHRKIISEPVIVKRRNPALSLAASTNVSSHLTQDGQTISYYFTVTNNTEDIILYTPTVTITTMPAGAVSTDTLIITRTSPLLPKASWSGSKTVTVTTESYETLTARAIATAQDTNQFYKGEATDSKDDIESFEANVIEISQSVTSTSTISDERITYTLYITNQSHFVPIDATIKDILPEEVTLLEGSQNEWGNSKKLTISSDSSITLVVTGTLTAGCLPEVLTNTIKVTTKQNVSHENSDTINLLGLATTISATKSGAWDDPSIWNSSSMSNSNRVPQSSDRVYIPKNIVITATDSIAVKTLRNDGRLVSQAGALLEINATTMLCNLGEIKAADLTESTHLSSDISLEAPVIENQGYITAGAGFTNSVGGSLLLEGDLIINDGTLWAGDGGNNSQGQGEMGGGIRILRQDGQIRLGEDSVIQSGNGGKGRTGGGDGGTISLMAQNLDVDGEIQSGHGGDMIQVEERIYLPIMQISEPPIFTPTTHIYLPIIQTPPIRRIYFPLIQTSGNPIILPTPTALASGNGGTIKLFGNYNQNNQNNSCLGEVILSAKITSGNGGNAPPSYLNLKKRGGNGGQIYLMSAPTLALQDDSQITAGQGGKGSTSAFSGIRGPIVISSGDGDGNQSCDSEISLANSATQIKGQDITLFGGDNFLLDLSNMAPQLAISATGKVHLATGANGKIDLSGNLSQIIKGNETTLAVTELLLPSGLELSDVAGDAKLVEPELLSGFSLVAPEPLRGKAKVPMRISFALINRGTQTETFKLSAESTGLSEIEISETLPVVVQGGEIKEVSAIITPSFELLDELYMTATLQNEEPQTATLKVRLIVDQTGFSRIYLPLIND